jgi:hypothetical protein
MKFPCTILYATIEQHIPIPEYEEDNVQNANSWSFTEEEDSLLEVPKESSLTVSKRSSVEEENHLSVLIDYKQSWIQNMGGCNNQQTSEKVLPVLEDNVVDVDEDSSTVVPSQNTQVPTEYNNSPSSPLELKSRMDDAVSFIGNRAEPGFNLSSSSSLTTSSRSNPLVEHETCEWSHIPLQKKKDEKSDIIKLQEFEDLNEMLLSRSNTATSWTSVKRKSSETSPIKKKKVNELLKDEDVDIEDDWMDSDYNRKKRKMKQLTLFNVSREKETK